MDEELHEIMGKMCQENLRSETFRSDISKTTVYLKLFERAKEILPHCDLQKINTIMSDNIVSRAYILELFDLVEEMFKYLDLSDGMSISYHPRSLDPFLYTLWFYSDRGRGINPNYYTHPHSLYLEYKKYASITEHKVFEKCLKNNKYCEKFETNETNFITAYQLKCKTVLPFEYNLKKQNIIYGIFAPDIAEQIIEMLV